MGLCWGESTNDRAFGCDVTLLDYIRWELVFFTGQSSHSFHLIRGRAFSCYHLCTVVLLPSFIAKKPVRDKELPAFTSLRLWPVVGCRKKAQVKYSLIRVKQQYPLEKCATLCYIGPPLAVVTIFTTMEVTTMIISFSNGKFNSNKHCASNLFQQLWMTTASGVSI